MADEFVLVRRQDLVATIREVIHDELADIRQAVLQVPDTTPLSDDDAANRLHTSVSTIRRMKKDGRINSVITAKGRMIRVCDIEAYYAPRKEFVGV